MSADNYGVVHPHGDGWGLSMGFASDEEELDLSRPYFTAPTQSEVEAFAHGEYFEYGWSTIKEQVSDNRADCLGGGYAYVGHGDDVVLLAFTEDVGWWRNAACLSPAEARRLAAVLVVQAERSEALTRERNTNDQVSSGGA